MQTEFGFTLPRGYVDGEGQVHRRGAMRLATAIDEIAPLRDPRVRANETYLAILILSRVITRLGTLGAITPEVVEGLFSADLAFLQELYGRINEMGEGALTVVCPECGHRHEVPMAP
jgi:hypothetical protein